MDSVLHLGLNYPYQCLEGCVEHQSLYVVLLSALAYFLHGGHKDSHPSATVLVEVRVLVVVAELALLAEVGAAVAVPGV